MARIKFELTFDTNDGSFSVVNMETGEIQEITTPKTKKNTSTKKPKDDGDPTPKIVLDDNKYSLNSAAAALLLNEGDENRLEIKFTKNGNIKVPTITNSNGGNKVTKSNTVSCRGKAHEALSEYGTVFTLTPYPGKSGVYIMTGDNAIQPLEGDENISIPVKDEKPATPVATEDDDLNLDDFLGDDEDNTTEMSSFDFSL